MQLAHLFVFVFVTCVFHIPAKKLPPADFNIKTRFDTFLEPEEVSSYEDIFTRNNTEYLFINFHLNYMAASSVCVAMYGARLAHVATVKLASFLAVALSETNLIFDALWIGSKKGPDKVWYWYEGDTQKEPLSRDIISLFVNYSQSVFSSDRDCLAIARKNHETPHFPAFKCQVNRPFVCERPVRDRPNNGSTHPGWIRIKKRLYKIFQERVTWEDAMGKCIVFDRNSRLAVVANFPDSQALGRYLLIGRPSLENAWIGARYYNDYYAFSHENIILANRTNIHRYPPWRRNVISKVGGCILLDRHISNITYFVEARCKRLRPYVCYKPVEDGQDHFIDIIIEEFGYRIYVNKLPWVGAKAKCDYYKATYQAKLAEIRERRIVSHLIYVMGENKTAFQHIWLGAVYDTKVEQWKWDSDRAAVKIGNLDWLVNTTYFDNVESENTCLNMDRENHLKAIHYGTVCDYEQSFVCSFPKDKLIQLEKDESSLAEQTFGREIK